jgi:hypothetical protein
MEQSKFSLADLLTVLGTLVFGFFCFLSVNYMTLGNTMGSLVSASVIALILGGLAFVVKFLKMTSRNFKTYIIWEWVLLLLFSMGAFFALFPFSHYFNVYADRSGIQKDVTLNITQAENLFPEYEKYANNRLDNYKSNLQSIVAAKDVNKDEYKNYGFEEGRDDKKQIDSKMFTLNAKLYPSNYNDIKKVVSTWLVKSKAKIINWSPTGIVQVINTVNPEMTKWKEQLIDFSKFRALSGENDVDDFVYQLTFNDVKKKITQQQSPTVFAVCIALGLYVLMLLSYFVSGRNKKSQVSLLFFLKKRKVQNSVDNEIDVKI